MRYRSLGRTGVDVSVLGLGAMNFGGRANRDDAARILDRALDAGINLIDTANVYGHDPAEFERGRGRSEEIVGRWLGGRHRDDVFLATKLYFPMSDRPGALGSSRANIVREAEASLRRLGVDHVDLLQLHHPSNDVPIDESLRALDHLVAAGKVRYVGTSSFAPWQLLESLWMSDRHHLTPASSEQCVYNLLERRPERELFPMTASYGLGVLTWSPLAGGLLADAARTAIPEGSRYERFWAGRRSAITPSTVAAVNRLAALAADAGLELHQLAHAWLLGNDAVSSVLIGPRTVAHLDAALTAVDATIDDDVSARIDRIVPPHRATMPQYGYDGMTWIPWGPHAHAPR